MSSEMEKQQIVDFVFADKKRFGVAMAVCGSYEAIKKKAICDFTAKLQQRLEQEFRDYSFDSTVLTYPENYIRIWIKKLGWKDISIGVHALKYYAKNFNIGIYKGKANDNNWPDLYKALGETYGPGRTDRWWYYCRSLEKYKDWEHDVLTVLLHDENALKYFVDEFAKLARIAGPIIDRGIVEAVP